MSKRTRALRPRLQRHGMAIHADEAMTRLRRLAPARFPLQFAQQSLCAD